MTLAIGDIVNDDRLHDSFVEGEDYVVEFAMYGNPGGGSGCSTPTLGAPRDLSGATVVFVSAREVATSTGVAGEAVLVAAGSATVPARARVTFRSSAVAAALAADGNVRQIQWTLYATDAALITTAQAQGLLTVNPSGQGGL